MNKEYDLENSIVQNLFYDGEFYSRVISSLKSENFESYNNASIINEIKNYILEFDKRPSLREIALQIKNSSSYNQKQKKEILETLQEYTKFNKIENTEFLIKETEKYIKKVQLKQAIYDSIDILQKDKDLEPVIEKVSNALNVSFDISGGLEYLSSISERVEYYQQRIRGLSTGIKTLDNALNGGFMDKTLNIFLSASGGGKSAMMVSVGANMLLKGKNILYITLEMSEKEIAKRFDANILDYDAKELKNADSEDLKTAFEGIRHSLGKLYIKEYSAGTFNTLHLKSLIEDFRNSKGVLFDVIFIDYLTLMNSYRTSLGKSGNSYSFYKCIAEELHGFSKICPSNNGVGLPIISACQLNRSAYNNLEVGNEHISDSLGILMTVDNAIMILQTEALRERNECILRFTKNRNSGILKDYVLKVEFFKSRFSDLENFQSNDFSLEKTTDFGEFKFD